MSTPRNSTPRPAAAPIGEGGSSRPKWLLPLVLGVIVLIALALLLSRCGGDDKEQAANTPTTAAATAPTAAAITVSAAAASSEAGAGSQAGAGQPGTVTAGGANLIGADNAQLRTYNGQQTVGRAVRVQSVPADEGFWVGSGELDRLWVQLTGIRGESDYRVKQGDTVDFTGTLTKAAQGFAAKTGVTNTEGGNQLTKQGYYVAAPASGVELSR